MNIFENNKYYIPHNLDRYIMYHKKTNKNVDEVIRLVNCRRDYEYYTNTLKANIDAKDLILVNKYYYLDKDYIPDNLIKIKDEYSIRGSIKRKVNKAFEKMCKDALKKNLHLINTSPYRSYERQEQLYKQAYLEKKEKADLTSAREGHSEHQTGLALDIINNKCDLNDFYNTDEYKWLSTNAYKYGFILRYPKGMEELTGYSFEPWHYRYVGKKVSKYIYENNITFDEYYAYFIDNKNN